VPLAADRVLADFSIADNNSIKILPKGHLSTVETIRELFSCVAYLVLKPAKYNINHLLDSNSEFYQGVKESKIKLVVTSYLDHPVGITHAYIEALRVKKMFGDQFDTCGLFSMGAYEDNLFKVEENIQRGFCNVPLEFGIGFNQLLESQIWIYCSQF
jgi:hypothetical protein